MYKSFRELLMEIKDKPLDEQSAILDEENAKWMGKEVQVDDIIIIGIKIE